MRGVAVGVGAALAEARRQAGLTVAQISQQTRIRETVIHAIERDDFSLCGGDFYARGHLRSIAGTLGVDPQPYVHAYDETHGGAPLPVRAARVFHAENPIKLRERRTPNWTAAMAVALLLIIVFAVVRTLGAGSTGTKTTESRIDQRPVSVPSAMTSPGTRPEQVRQVPAGNLVTIQIKARQASWVSVEDAEGKRLFKGTISAGRSRTWEAPKQVKVIIGNAGGVNLVVNGVDLGPQGKRNEVVRRTFGPGLPTHGSPIP